ncbi:DNA polymerase IV [Actinomyces polynesiensis]|uniref:DNA polymerase IV n=1 Tax=Actinomyces polynesiensis TaxID=1325934 RepID=UPI0005BE0B15|nr:DNA polymerase IV [Actinomyces polynesiensis]
MSNAPRDSRARRDWGDDDSGTDILHVDMDSFFASVELVEDPSLADRPLIVGGTGPRGVVTSATYPARACGVRAGMPTGRARALCPQARVVQGRHGVYGEYSRRVMAVLADVTPALEQVSVDEAFLDVSGARLRLGTPVRIGTGIRRRIREEVGLPASVGIAATKSVAKIASSHAKPDGLLLVPAGATVDFLHGLPVGALWGVGGRTGEVLDREGITTVGDLAHTDVARLVRLVGQASGHHLHDLAWGIDRRSVTPGREEKSIGTESTFSEDVVDRASLERFILRASHQCAVRLRAAGCVAWTVGIKMRGADFATITRSSTLPAPTDVGREIARAAGTLFARETIPTGGVRLLGVRVEGLRRRSEGVAVTLDEDGRPLAAERAMDAITERFGGGSVRPASLLDDGA